MVPPYNPPFKELDNMLRKDFDHSKMEGVDIDLEISLKEYGIAWIKGETETLFYYGLAYGENEYVTFDFVSFANNTDIKKEFEWANFKEVSEFIEIDIFSLPLEQQINSLNSYYGREEIFGPSYWNGLTYEEIFQV